MVKCIVFDWYGVCTKKPWRVTFSKELSYKLGIDSSKVRVVFRKVCPDYEKNKIHGKEFVKLMLKNLNCKQNPEEFYYLIDSQPDINWNVMNLIKELKKKYRIFLFSNNYEDVFNEVKKDLKDLKIYFDETLFSFDLKMRKNEIEMYKVLLEKAQVEPSEIVFVDDHQKPLELAVTFGIKGILYKNYKQLLDELMNLGVDF